MSILSVLSIFQIYSKMYSVRPYTTQNTEFNLQTTMYSVPPYNQSIKVTKETTAESELQEFEQRQDHLLEKVENLFNQLVLYLKHESMEKATLSLKSIREEFVIHLSAKQPSENIVKLIEQFREKLSIRTFRHSSLRNQPFNSPLAATSSSTNNRKLTVIWSAEENLPSMFHARMQLNDEQAIINLLTHQLTNAD